MEKTMITTGKTIDLAIEAALSQLGLERDDVSVQVLAQAKAGFLGFGATPAKVQVTYEAPDLVPETPKVALSSASRSKTKPAAPVKKQPVKEGTTNIPEAPKMEKPKAPEVSKAEKPKLSSPGQTKPVSKKAPVQPKTFAPAEPGSVEESIETFLHGLLKHMGSDAVPHCIKKDTNTYHVELVGEDLGYLIGRRGDTLDAIQHLCNYSIRHGSEGHLRICVDAEDYREKREESLRRYARKKAQQVLKNRRRTTLEPMNAYERHVIHATLQEMENISTHSTGTEPNRRVVVEYVK